jgi:hypothetical protein
MASPSEALRSRKAGLGPAFLRAFSPPRECLHLSEFCLGIQCPELGRYQAFHKGFF